VGSMGFVGPEKHRRKKRNALRLPIHTVKGVSMTARPESKTSD